MKIDRYAPRWWCNRQAERKLTNTGVLTVGTHDKVDLARSAPFEFDADPPVVLCRRVRTESPNATSTPSATTPNRMRTKSSRMISISRSPRASCRGRNATSGAPAVGTHRRQRHDLRSRVADRGVEPHPFDDLERGAADVDRVPADPQFVCARPAWADGPAAAASRPGRGPRYPHRR